MKDDLKVILDTDIGDDIDDAFALGIALKEVKGLVAVTTVFKNTVARAHQARELIELAGCDVPVYAGCVYPLNKQIIGFQKDQGDLATILPCQYDEGMEKTNIGFSAPYEIIRLAKKYSTKLVIVSIGPLTNLATALEIDPSIAKDICAIYDMGANFETIQPEWNVLCDVEAYKIVFDSGIPFYGVGLNVTMQCPLDGDLFTKMRQSNDPITQRIMVWFDRWMDYFGFEKSILHDPLALCSLIDSDVCHFEKRWVRVILDGELRSAVEVKTQQEAGFMPIYVAVEVNKNKFYDMIEKNFIH